MLYKRNLIPALILALHCYQVIKVCISSFSKITQFFPWIFSSCTNNIKSWNFNPLSLARSYAPPEKVMFSALVSNAQICLLCMWFLHNGFSKKRRKYWIKEYFHHKMIKKLCFLEFPGAQNQASIFPLWLFQLQPVKCDFHCMMGLMMRYSCRYFSDLVPQ